MENLSRCSLYINSSCWRRLVDEMNYDKAVLMSPVIVMMALFMVVGAFGNALVLFVYHHRKHRATNLYIRLLAVTDLFACIVIHPYIIYKLFNNHSQTWVSLCKIFEFFVHLNLGLSALILLLIAVDRYFAICRPVKFLLIDRNMHKGIVAVFISSFVVSLPLLEFYGAAPYDITVGDIIFVEYKCHYRVEYQNSPVLLGFSCFIMFGFLMQTIAMAILYKNVAVTAYRKSRTVMPLSNAHILAGITSTTQCRDTHPSTPVGSLVATTALSQHVYSAMEASSTITRNTSTTNIVTETTDMFASNTSNSRSSPVRVKSTAHETPDRKHFASRLKAAKMLFLVTTVFFFSWLPFFVLRICSVLVPQFFGDLTDVKQVAESMLNHFIYLSNAANPLIYTIINQNFRQDSVLVFKRCCRLQRQPR